MSQKTGALATVEEFADEFLRVVETEMEKAIRVISKPNMPYRSLDSSVYTC